MPIDVGNQTDRERLFKAIKTSRESLNIFRKVRTAFLQDHVGSWYSQNGAKMPTLVNLLNQTARIYSMALAFNNPQVKITSFDQKLWPFCAKYQVNVNRVVANIDLKTTMQEGVLDAFYLMGIFNVRMADAGEVQLDDNVWIDPGKPWVDRISFDDAILDMSAKDIRAMRFWGHRYRCSYDNLMRRDDFDSKVLKKIRATSKSAVDDASDRASEIASGGAVDDDELEPMVWLQDVYLPDANRIATFSADNEELPPLKNDKWTGSTQSGYKFLRLGLVPDNIMPSSPAHNLKGLHELANRLYRKLSAQATRQKTVTGYRSGSQKDADRRKNARDGEYIAMDDPKNVQDFSTPGVDGNTHVFFLAANEVFNAIAGNPRAIGGLGAAADTLGQEQMIQGNALGMISQMKQAVVDCASEICREIGGLMFDDDFLSVDSSMEVENTGRYIDSSWRPGERMGIKDHYDFCVEPNSMSYRPPEAKFRDVMEVMQSVGIVLPLVQAGVVDLQAFAKFAAEYRNIPELQKMFKVLQQQESLGGASHEATKPPVTSREVIRRDRGNPQGAQGGGLAAIMSQMMQSNGQQATMGAA